MDADRPLEFGDCVRIRETDETRRRGLAGQEGDVCGLTTPSASRVEVIGGADDDYALGVRVDSLDRDIWIHPELLERIPDRPGMELTIGRTRFVRKDGEWIPADRDDASTRRPWWKFW